MWQERFFFLSSSSRISLSTSSNQSWCFLVDRPTTSAVVSCSMDFICFHCSSGSKHWHLLDYVLTRQRDTRDVVHTKVMPSADCHNGLSEFSPEEWNCGSAFKKTTPASLGDNYLPAQRTAARQQKGLKQQLVLRMSWAYSGIMASALFPRPTGIPAE